MSVGSEQATVVVVVVAAVLLLVLAVWVLLWVFCLRDLEKRAVESLEEKQQNYEAAVAMRDRDSDGGVFAINPALNHGIPHNVGDPSQRMSVSRGKLVLKTVEVQNRSAQIEQNGVEMMMEGVSQGAAEPQVSQAPKHSIWADHPQGPNVDYLELADQIGPVSPGESNDPHRAKLETPMHRTITPADHLANADFGSPGKPGNEDRWYDDDESVDGETPSAPPVVQRSHVPSSVAMASASPLRVTAANFDKAAIMHGVELDDVDAERLLRRYAAIHEDADTEGCWLLRLRDVRGQDATYIVSALFNGQMLHHRVHVMGSNITINGTRSPVASLGELLELLDARSDLYPHGLGLNVPPEERAVDVIGVSSTASATRNSGQTGRTTVDTHGLDHGIDASSHGPPQHPSPQHDIDAPIQNARSPESSVVTPKDDHVTAAPPVASAGEAVSQSTIEATSEDAPASLEEYWQRVRSARGPRRTSPNGAPGRASNASSDAMVKPKTAAQQLEEFKAGQYGRWGDMRAPSKEPGQAPQAFSVTVPKARPMRNDRLRKHEEETTAHGFTVVKFKKPS